MTVRLCKQGVTGSIPVTSTIFQPANQSFANSDFAETRKLGPFVSNKKLLHSFERSALFRWDRLQGDAAPVEVAHPPKVRALAAISSSILFKWSCHSPSHPLNEARKGLRSDLRTRMFRALRVDGESAFVRHKDAEFAGSRQRTWRPHGQSSDSARSGIHNPGTLLEETSFLIRGASWAIVQFAFDYSLDVNHGF